LHHILLPHARTVGLFSNIHREPPNLSQFATCVDKHHMIQHHQCCAEQQHVTLFLVQKLMISCCS